jgi:hypothetical protein
MKKLILISTAAAVLAVPAFASASRTAHIETAAPGEKVVFEGEDCIVRAEVNDVSVVASAKERRVVTSLDLGRERTVKVLTKGDDRVVIRNTGDGPVRAAIVVDANCVGGQLSVR